MKRALTFLALFALVASVAASSAQAAPVKQDRAKLVSKHVIKPGKGKPAGRANCSNDNGTASASEFLLIGKRVTESSRTYHLTISTIPASAEAAGAGSTEAALQASFNVWRVVEPAAPPITVAPTGTATKHSANDRNEVMWGRTGGSLATAYTWRYTDGHYETDVVFDKGYKWVNLSDGTPEDGTEGDGCFEDAGNVYDVGNIATHEFGHVYGLNHPSPGRFQTMYAYGYSGETLKRSPAAGDATGIALLYD